MTLRVGDLVRLADMPENNIGITDDMAGEIMAVHPLRIFAMGRWQTLHYYTAAIGNLVIQAPESNFDLVLTSQGGMEPVDFDWRRLTKSAMSKALK